MWISFERSRSLKNSKRDHPFQLERYYALAILYYKDYIYKNIVK